MTTETVVIDADEASAPRPSTPQPLGQRQCGWCVNTFPIARRPGRPLIYCSRSCRQRAYERRRGLGVLPPPERIITQAGGPLGHLRPQPGGYERGKLTAGMGKEHAMRPSGITNVRGRRLTLCGLLGWAVNGRFHPPADNACLTCARIDELRAPARPVRPSADLAALRSLLDAAAVEFSRSPSSRHRVRGPGEILTDLLLAV